MSSKAKGHGAIRTTMPMYENMLYNENDILQNVTDLGGSRQRGSSCSVIDDIEFSMAILEYFFLAAV